MHACNPSITAFFNLQVSFLQSTNYKLLHRTLQVPQLHQTGPTSPLLLAFQTDGYYKKDPKFAGKSYILLHEQFVQNSLTNWLEAPEFQF